MNKHCTVRLIGDNYQTVASDHLSTTELLTAYSKPQYYSLVSLYVVYKLFTRNLSLE